jgi:hypothetical protein
MLGVCGGVAKDVWGGEKCQCDSNNMTMAANNVTKRNKRNI